MAYKVYSSEKLTEVCRLLLEMRDNCMPKESDKYDDPDRMAKREALSIALEALDQIPWGYPNVKEGCKCYLCRQCR